MQAVLESKVKTVLGHTLYFLCLHSPSITVVSSACNKFIIRMCVLCMLSCQSIPNGHNCRLCSKFI